MGPSQSGGDAVCEEEKQGKGLEKGVCLEGTKASLRGCHLDRGWIGQEELGGEGLVGFGLHSWGGEGLMGWGGPGPGAGLVTCPSTVTWPGAHSAVHCQQDRAAHGAGEAGLGQWGRLCCNSEKQLLDTCFFPLPLIPIPPLSLLP